MPRKNKNARARVRRPVSAAKGHRAPESKPEALFKAALEAAGVPSFSEQYRFHDKRRWLFDFAWPSHRVACEVEGGIFVRGRHVSPSGFIKDCEKYNTATADGWRILRIPVAGKTWIEDGVGMVIDTLVYADDGDWL